MAGEIKDVIVKSSVDEVKKDEITD